MLNEKIKNTIEELKGSGKTFAEFIAEVFRDQFVEIYLGDAYEEISVEQTSQSLPAVFYGKVVGAYRECLIINSAQVKNKKIAMGKILFISERAIRALSVINDDTSINDVILNGSDAKLIKSHFDSIK